LTLATPLLFLDSKQVRQALPMPAAIDAMRSAFSAIAEGKVQIPMRNALSSSRGVTLVMPGAIDDGETAALAVKVVSVFPDNKLRGIPTIQGLVLVIDRETGQLSGIIDGAALTAIRTAAVCGLATDLLSRQDSRILAVIGSGVQARTQVEAVCCVRDIEQVRICNPNLDSAEAAVGELRGQGRIPTDVSATSDSTEALRGADIVCAATTSPSPVFSDQDVGPGTHLNAIGSFQPSVREIPSETVARSLLIVDERQAALEEAGDILQAIADDSITENHIHCELGDLVLGRAPGRTRDDQITFFKSVGLAVQDVAASRAALAGAQKLRIGLQIAE
jgi:ornithine cyclodeaminase/alanine dehydrogenase-like protein (mu-crystallin family)